MGKLQKHIVIDSDHLIYKGKCMHSFHKQKHDKTQQQFVQLEIWLLESFFDFGSYTQIYTHYAHYIHSFIVKTNSSPIKMQLLLFACRVK